MIVTIILAQILPVVWENDFFQFHHLRNSHEADIDDSIDCDKTFVTPFTCVLNLRNGVFEVVFRGWLKQHWQWLKNSLVETRN